MTKHSTHRWSLSAVVVALVWSTGWACGVDPVAEAADTAAGDVGEVADTAAGDVGEVADTAAADVGEVADTAAEDVEDTAAADVEDVADTDVVAPPCPGGDGGLIGPEGGEIVHGAATLTVPPGALTEPTVVCVRDADAPVPSGYTGYSTRYALSPSGLTFARPARLAVALDAAPVGSVAGFLSRPDGPAFEWLGATVDGALVTTLVPHFSDAFFGDGADFTDPPDVSCAVTRLLEGRVVPPSGVALFVTADDCHGTPLTGLAPEDFALSEDGGPLTSESARAARAQDGVAVFVTLVFDMSSSTATVLTQLIDAGRAFVARLADLEGKVYFAIDLFSGPQHSEVWQGFTVDPEVALARLDALATYVSSDPAATNLRGAVVDALDRSAAAQAAYRERQHGGAFTLGHVVLFTDGRDTAGWLPEADAVAAVTASADEVVGVGLRTDDYDEEALSRLCPGRVYSALDAPGLETAFVALANRVARQAARSYALFYCSPKKLGEHVASVRIVDAEMAAEAGFTFDADGFAPGCSAEAFVAACDGRACGGLGCGGCDERRDVCVADTGACLDACTADCPAPGVVGGPVEMTHPAGHPQTCDAECDRDGVPVPADGCPWADDADQADYDGDGAGDACDPDWDGDGVANDVDRCPLGTLAWSSVGATDHDGDGCRDVDEDADDDDDGRLDGADACPAGAVGELTGETDWDGDGCRDADEDLDDDGDGVADSVDACPTGALGGPWTAESDLDGDGCRDADEDTDDDGDGVEDGADGCARGDTGWQASAATDHDGDGCQDAGEDADDDGDGVADADDACPRGDVAWTASADTDLDGDGCRDAGEDADDDGDGVADDVDACPLLLDAGEDLDGTGCPDATEDTDGDGVFNRDDLCPMGGPCSCAPSSGWCLTGEAQLEGASTNSNDGTAGFGAGASACIMRYDGDQVSVALQTLDGGVVWDAPVLTISSLPVPDGYTDVHASVDRRPIRVRRAPGVACAMVIEVLRGGTSVDTGNSTSIDVRYYLIELTPDGTLSLLLPLLARVGWVARADSTVIYGPGSFSPNKELVRVDPATGQELWRVPRPTVDGVTVTPSTGVLLDDGVLWVAASVAGTGAVTRTPALIAYDSAAGTRLDTVVLDEPCACESCSYTALELYPTSDGLLRVTGSGYHVAFFDPATAQFTSFASSCDLGSCTTANSSTVVPVQWLGPWADADCRIEMDVILDAPSGRPATLSFCDSTGEASGLVYEHGTALLRPLQARVRPGFVDFLVGFSGQVWLTTFEPCASPP